MGWQEREAGSRTVHFQRCEPPGRTFRLDVVRDLLSARGRWQVPMTLRARCCGAPRLAVSTGCGGAGVTVTLPLRAGAEHPPCEPSPAGKDKPAQNRLSPRPRANTLRIDLSRQAAAPLPAQPGCFTARPHCARASAKGIWKDTAIKNKNQVERVCLIH